MNLHMQRMAVPVEQGAVNPVACRQAKQLKKILLKTRFVEDKSSFGAAKIRNSGLHLN